MNLAGDITQLTIVRQIKSQEVETYKTVVIYFVYKLETCLVISSEELEINLGHYLVFEKHYHRLAVSVSESCG